MQYGYVYDGDSTASIEVDKIPKDGIKVADSMWEDKAKKGKKYEIIEADEKPF